MGLKVVLVVEVFADQSVVVDLSVDGKDDGLIGVGEGLGARLYILLLDLDGLGGQNRGLPSLTDTDDTETLMAENYHESVGIPLDLGFVEIGVLVLLEITFPPRNHQYIVLQYLQLGR